MTVNRDTEWVIEKGSAYSLGDDWIGSDIYADVDGEMASICSVHLVLTQKEHLKLRKIENERDKSLDVAVASTKTLKTWWQKIRQGNSDDNESNWKVAQEKYIKEREELYKRPKILHDKYLSIILSAQSAVNLLKNYKETGTIDKAKLERVLAIADGNIAPMFQYVGQICSCGHLESEHATEYLYFKNRGKCTVPSCDCKHFEHATDVVSEVKTYDLKSLRRKKANR
jgi:hypothetical protein